MKFKRVAIFAGALVVGPQMAGAQEAADLPAVDVVQGTPAQNAARARKQAPAVTPLATAPATVASEGLGAGGAQGAAGGGLPAPITVPSAVTNITDADIAREGTGQVQEVLQQRVPGIIISDAAGNPIRSEVNFRGFTVSSVSGRAQGLAVYQNGVRINEAFGDVVQWDFLPSNAIDSMSVVSNNPSFGLNALGGAISIQMKDGFSYQGGEIDVMAGSFGRRQVGVQAGGTSGNASAYVAAEGIWDDSFRHHSDSEIKRFYGDLGFKGTFAEVHFSLSAAKNEIGASAAAPVELLEESWSNTFTTPQESTPEMIMPTLSAKIKATDTLTFSGVGYYRHYKNSVIDGNVTEIEECSGSPYLCLIEEDEDGNEVEEIVTGPGGPILADDDLDPLGSVDRLRTKSDSWGGVLEGQEKTPLFGRPNLFIAGVSYDHGTSNYRTSSELATIRPGYVAEGAGIIVTGPDELAPRDLDTENTYWGVYFSNAMEVTDQLTVTVGGRYNHATIKMEDNTGEFDELNATNKYDRFNPMAGANYKLLPGLSVYGGYSESNRAPTPAELGCAEPEVPCLIESFLTDDPPLDQVVGRTGEIGLRGQGFYNGGRYTWGAGLFRTMSEDDILPIINDTGRIYFVNAGDTLRQGVELTATYETRTWNVYANYAFVDATLDKCTNPGEEGDCAFLESGDRLPGIPRHIFKAGFDYWLTHKWKVGADLVAASNQPLYPNEEKEEADEDGISSMLGGYTRVDLHTSYDITDNIQVYGLIKNLFDQKYGLYGTYFEADDAPDLRPGGTGFENPRTISPAQPFAAYGGVKVRF
ncbi:TonB-dependent receptor [Hyphomicrobium sp.]|uniref:TonB-dependent receptor n=1 Tax=Hyphomicrobium sp. TaxID=82 RepID=UPI002FE04C37